MHSTELFPNLAEVRHKPMFKYVPQILFGTRLKKSSCDDVESVRRYVLKHGPFVDVLDLPKSNARATEVRQAGNRHYQKKDYKTALEKYNESICWATGDSEDLGIGYANRSAVYYDQGEYELAMANIALAKKHNYPHRLLPKLLTRDINCREQIDNGRSKCTSASPRLAMNVEVNPKIPFLAKGIRMQMLPDFGRSMIAERSFKPGDVILNEKPTVASIESDVKYLFCDHCSISNFHSLIPCPNCVSVMYCGEECMAKGLQFVHRFECGISEKLHYVSFGRTNMGPKMFFYGLGLFKDNLTEMMACCEKRESASSVPSNLDYTKYDPLEEFKVLHNVKLLANTAESESHFRIYAAVYYSVYIKSPLVNSIFVTEAQRSFMLRTFLDYIRMALMLYIGQGETYTFQIFSIASVCNHSCDPNAQPMVRAGQLKFIVIQPISKGDQICISYGPIHSEHSERERKVFMTGVHFDCLCVVCDSSKRKVWQARGSLAPPIPRTHLMTLHMVIHDATANNAAKLNALQQFVQRYSNVHPQEKYDWVLRTYMGQLVQMFEEETEATMRAKYTV